MRRILVFAVVVILGALLVVVYAILSVAAKTALMPPQTRLHAG